MCVLVHVDLYVCRGGKAMDGKQKYGRSSPYIHLYVCVCSRFVSLNVCEYVLVCVTEGVCVSKDAWLSPAVRDSLCFRLICLSARSTWSDPMLLLFEQHLLAIQFCSPGERYSYQSSLNPFFSVGYICFRTASRQCDKILQNKLPGRLWILPDLYSVQTYRIVTLDGLFLYCTSLLFSWIISCY